MIKDDDTVFISFFPVISGWEDYFEDITLKLVKLANNNDSNCSYYQLFKLVPPDKKDNGVTIYATIEVWQKAKEINNDNSKIYSYYAYYEDLMHCSPFLTCYTGSKIILAKQNINYGMHEKHILKKHVLKKDNKI